MVIGQLTFTRGRDVLLHIYSFFTCSTNFYLSLSLGILTRSPNPHPHDLGRVWMSWLLTRWTKGRVRVSPLLPVIPSPPLRSFTMVVSQSYHRKQRRGAAREGGSCSCAVLRPQQLRRPVQVQQRWRGLLEVLRRLAAPMATGIAAAPWRQRRQKADEETVGKLCRHRVVEEDSGDR
jgi:hypothetical protein